MKKIKLQKGFFTIVDDDDYGELVKYKWYAHCKVRKHYVLCCIPISKKKGIFKRSELSMSRYILNISDPKIVVDHINGNTFDNRRSNLRACTSAENTRNMVKHKDSSSKYKGVHCIKINEKWRSIIRVNKIAISLGYFTNEIEAAKAYDIAAVKYFGEFARPNF